jgi:nitroreductase/dihydropteridine reductase
MSTIDYYNWRYATKEFNSEKKITNSDLEIIKESIRLSPSSYGLQLFKVFIIESQILKDKLRKVSFNQSQISDASHLFVFCNYTKVIEKDIDLYIQNKSLIQQMPITKNEGYGVFLKKNLLKKETEETSIWTNNQVYIALANLMTTCASLKIDSCPIEGFEASKYNEILNINERNMNAAVVCAVGYRSKLDTSQHEKKVRKSSQDLFEII